MPQPLPLRPGAIETGLFRYIGVPDQQVLRKGDVGVKRRQREQPLAQIVVMLDVDGIGQDPRAPEAQAHQRHHAHERQRPAGQIIQSEDGRIPGRAAPTSASRRRPACPPQPPGTGPARTSARSRSSAARSAANPAWCSDDRSRRSRWTTAGSRRRSAARRSFRAGTPLSSGSRWPATMSGWVQGYTYFKPKISGRNRIAAHRQRHHDVFHDAAHGHAGGRAGQVHRHHEEERPQPDGRGEGERHRYRTGRSAPGSEYSPRCRQSPKSARRRTACCGRPTSGWFPVGNCRRRDGVGSWFFRPAYCSAAL